MNRPTGVTVIAILGFLGAVLCVLCGILLIAGGGFLATLMHQRAQGDAAAAGIIAGMGVVVGVVVLVLGGVYALVSWGLLALKEWARITTIVLSAIAALLQIPGLLRALAHFNPVSLIWAALFLAIDIVIIWYLLKPEVKSAFKTS